MANKKEATLLLKIQETGSSALKNVRNSLNDLGKVAAGVWAGFLTASYFAIDAFKGQEEATNTLNQAMVNAGVYTKELADSYAKLSTKLQETTLYGDEVTMSAIATIQAYSKGIPVTEEMVRATQDFAAAKKVDLATAADLVGKTLGTTTNALMRYGVAVDATASTQQKSVQIIKQINDAYKGQSQVAAEGLGTITQAKNAFGDFGEEIGKRLAPTVSGVAKILTSMFTDLQRADSILNSIGTTAAWLVEKFLYAKFAVVVFVTTIQGYLDSLYRMFSALNIAATDFLNPMKLMFKLVANAGNAKKALDDVASSAEMTGQLVLEAQEKLDAELKTMDDQRAVYAEQMRQRESEMIKQSEERNAQIKRDAAAKAYEEKLLADQIQADMVLAQRDLNDEQLLAHQIAYLDKRINAEKNADAKLGLMQAKHALVEKQMDDAKHAAKIAATQEAFGTIATLSQSGNKTLAAIGKAAAITNIAISAPQGIARAWELGPILGPPAAALVATAFAAQAAQVAGIQLAQGGIVRATPGGIQATIGEGGRDEAVIPLDSDEARGRLGGGSNITIVVNGGLLGDQSSAREFAIAVDKELLRLRQNNESQAFDTGVI